MKLKYLKQNNYNKNMKWLNFLFIFIFLISFSSAIIDNIGTKKLNDCIDLVQTCPDCTYVNFSSYTMPNGTRIITEWGGTQSGITFTYNNCNITSQLGQWLIDGHGDIGGIDTTFSYTYDVTSTGNPTPAGVPIFQGGLLLIIFGTACFLLFISIQVNEVGVKIFFLILSFIFLLATMLDGYLVSMDSNVSASVNSATFALVTVLSIMLVIIFIYVLIRQTVNALDMYNIKKGRSWNVGMGNSVAGYNTKRAY